MKLTFISVETLTDLRTNYEEYKTHYYDANHEWFEKYFKEEGRVLESAIEFDFPDLNMDQDVALSDRENVKILYNALAHLNVAQATQERLWSGLAHLQMREYMFYRLSKERIGKNDKRINTAIFFKRGNKRSLFVHILARLWWVGYMTYDESNKENPYWLTDFFCEKDFSARSVVFFSSNLTSNRNITIGILRSIYKLKSRGITVRREHFVQATKYLNVVGGAMILDMLDCDDVEDMVDRFLQKYFKFNDVEEKVIIG